MTGQPLVTVIAVCYNHARFVIECLDSIRNQTYPHMQIIIMDDCSQDDSVEIIRDWIARYGIECKFIAHQKNQGLCRTLNEALSHADGKYVSLIATDDLWLPDKIICQVEVMEKLPDSVAVLYGDTYLINEAGAPLPGLILDQCRDNLGTPPVGNIFPVLLEVNTIPALTALIRRSCYEKVGYYDENLRYEDWDMWLRIAQSFSFAYAPEPLSKYRQVATSMQRTLLDTENPRRYQDNFVIFHKCLTAHQLNREQRSRLVRGLEKDAEKLYELNCADAHRFLWQAYRAGHHFRPLLLAGLASLRVPYLHIARMDRRFAKLMNYARWRVRHLFTT